MKIADYVFETSWEICNKVGGIYTVLSTKAFTAVNHYKDNYICLGPDLSKEQNNDFIEDSSLFKNWRDFAGNEGLKFRIGRWNIAGSPIVILVDFTPFFEKKNEILTHFWLRYKLDSIAGQWDYVEPALFGYAAGRVIESFYQFYCSANDKIIAHFHEWMTGTGILHLEDTVPQIATVFTTHATVLGRCLAGNNFPLYSNMNSYNPQECANRFGVQSKFSLEYLSAVTADAFTTVSQITNTECEAFFGKKVDAITINGFENSFVPQDADYEKKRKIARHKLIAVAQALTQQKIDDNALLIINSGRYEFKNKGIDIFIDALGRLNSENVGRELVAFIAVPAGTTGCRADLLNRMEVDEKSMPVLGDYATHRLHDYSNDPIIRKIKECQLLNAPEKDVKVIFVPVYLNGFDGIFDMPYYDLLAGFDLSVFPSYYEPSIDWYSYYQQFILGNNNFLNWSLIGNITFGHFFTQTFGQMSYNSVCGVGCTEIYGGYLHNLIFVFILLDIMRFLLSIGLSSVLSSMLSFPDILPILPSFHTGHPSNYKVSMWEFLWSLDGSNKSISNHLFCKS